MNGTGPSHGERHRNGTVARGLLNVTLAYGNSAGHGPGPDRRVVTLCKVQQLEAFRLRPRPQADNLSGVTMGESLAKGDSDSEAHQNHSSTTAKSLANFKTSLPLRLRLRQLIVASPTSTWP